MFFVGIDIAKAFSVCSVIDDKEEMIIKPFPFNSTSGGFKKLINNIVSLNCDTKDIIIGMEATGLLFENLYRYLSDLNYNVILLNPYQTAQYRNMVTMKYVKNDNIDSLIISLLIKSGRYSKGYVNEEQLQSLKVLFRHKENIKDITERNKNKINNNTPPNDLTKSVKIIVDTREKIISRYLYNKANLEFKPLNNGDFILSDRVIVERKTAEDLESSIIDKRLFKQLKDLKKYERPILIVEGNDYFRLSEKIINGTMVSIMLDFNIPVIFTKDIEETANILIKMAEREQLRDKRTISIRTGKKPMSLKERQRFIVESFPDIGALMAENLLMKFATIENIVKASVEELREVEGIGEITAKKIKAILTEKYEK